MQNISREILSKHPAPYFTMYNVFIIIIYLLRLCTYLVALVLYSDLNILGLSFLMSLNYIIHNISYSYDISLSSVLYLYLVIFKVEVITSRLTKDKKGELRCV